MDEFVAVGLGERAPEGQQLVQRDAEPVHVRPRIRPPGQRLWGHVNERARGCLRTPGRNWYAGLRQPKVADPDVPAGIEQKIRGLDISMEDAMRMGGVQGVCDIDAESGEPLPISAFRGERQDW